MQDNVPASNDLTPIFQRNFRYSCLKFAPFLIDILTSQIIVLMCHFLSIFQKIFFYCIFCGFFSEPSPKCRCIRLFLYLILPAFFLGGGGGASHSRDCTNLPDLERSDISFINLFPYYFAQNFHKSNYAILVSSGRISPNALSAKCPTNFINVDTL